MRQNHPELEIDYFFTDTGKELSRSTSFSTALRVAQSTSADGRSPTWSSEFGDLRCRSAGPPATGPTPHVSIRKGLPPKWEVSPVASLANHGSGPLPSVRAVWTEQTAC